MSQSQGQQTAHYQVVSDSGTHKKWIHVDSSKTGAIEVTFKAYSDWSSGQENEDCKPLPWRRFVDLMEAIEREHSESFVRDVFVGGAGQPTEVSDRNEINGTTTVGVMESTQSEDGSYLHFYYDGDYDPGSERLCMRWVQDENGGPPSSKGSPAGDIYSWQVLDHELQALLVENPNLPSNATSNSGFDRDFREALFLERDQSRVRTWL